MTVSSNCMPPKSRIGKTLRNCCVSSLNSLYGAAGELGLTFVRFLRSFTAFSYAFPSVKIALILNLPGPGSAFSSSRPVMSSASDGVASSSHGLNGTDSSVTAPDGSRR